MRSRSLSAALAAIAALALFAPAEVAAQPCCGGVNAVAPARLAPDENALIFLQAKVTDIIGSFDAHRRFQGAPKGTAEIDLEQDVGGAVRVFSKGQLSALLPLVETWRRVPGLSEGGGDLGDLQLGARVDFTLAGASGLVPGIALALGLTLPTGRPPEAARYPLATDATGIGALQGSLALGIEQIFGPVLVNVTGSVGWRAARSVGDIREQQGFQFVGFGAASYTFKNDASLALTAAYVADLDATINGARVPASGRAATRLGVALGAPIAGAFRVLGSLSGDLPIRSLGLNQPAGVGLGFILIRSWS